MKHLLLSDRDEPATDDTSPQPDAEANIESDQETDDIDWEDEDIDWEDDEARRKWEDDWGYPVEWREDWPSAPQIYSFNKAKFKQPWRSFAVLSGIFALLAHDFLTGPADASVTVGLILTALLFFGVVFLNFILPLFNFSLVLDERGITFKGQFYPWTQVQSLRDETEHNIPRLKVYLEKGFHVSGPDDLRDLTDIDQQRHNGKILRIRTDLLTLGPWNIRSAIQAYFNKARGFPLPTLGRRRNR